VKKTERFRKECLEGLRRAEALRPAILEAPKTVSERLEQYNQLLTAASASNALAGLMSEVHPDEAVRDTARECEQEVSRFYSDLALDRDVYDALAEVDVSGADEHTQRFLGHTLRDYRRAGVDKAPEVRQRLKKIDEDLTRLGQQFSKNISEDVRAIEVDDESRLAGLPRDFIANHPPDSDGKIRITTDYPDYNPFMTYAADDELRRQLYVAFRSRGDQQNESVLRDILVLRAEKAHLLGYADWADYITADKMIGSGARAAEFIDKVWQLAAPRAERDYKELLRKLQTIDKGAKAVADWQKVWLENLVKKEVYEVDASEVRQYFPYERVLAGCSTSRRRSSSSRTCRCATRRSGTRACSSTTSCAPTPSSAASTSTCTRARANTSTRPSSRSRMACTGCSCQRVCWSAISRNRPPAPR